MEKGVPFGDGFAAAQGFNPGRSWAIQHRFFQEHVAIPPKRWKPAI